MRLDLGDGHFVPGLVALGQALFEDRQRGGVVVHEEGRVELQGAQAVLRGLVGKQRDQRVDQRHAFADQRLVVQDLIEPAAVDGVRSAGVELDLQELGEAAGEGGGVAGIALEEHADPFVGAEAEGALELGGAFVHHHGRAHRVDHVIALRRARRLEGEL